MGGVHKRRTAANAVSVYLRVKTSAALRRVTNTPMGKTSAVPRGTTNTPWAKLRLLSQAKLRMPSPAIASLEVVTQVCKHSSRVYGQLRYSATVQETGVPGLLFGLWPTNNFDRVVAFHKTSSLLWNEKAGRANTDFRSYFGPSAIFCSQVATGLCAICSPPVWDGMRLA